MALAAAVMVATPLAAFAAVSYNSSTTAVQQGQTGGINNPAETISFEGQGSLNKVIAAAAFGYLNLTGTNGSPSITLNNGPGGTPVTYSDTSTSTSAYLNLASSNFTKADVGVNSPSTAQQTQSALRLEWHWNGTVDGSNDLINDQVGYNQATGPVSPQAGANRGPTVANPIYVNGANHFDGTAAGSGPNNLVTLNGLSLSNNTGGPTNPNDTYNTYSAANYDQAGNNLLGGTNRVQFSFSDYKTMDYAAAGTPSYQSAPGSPGYGLGNPALPQAAGNPLGIGVAGARESYQSGAIASMPTTNIDPQTVSTANPSGTAYASGPWNTAGLDNISSTPVAANAVLMAANPGTGLSRLNKSDSQWLQTTGRLANGARFDVVTRDADLGQRPTFATATGIDGTWAVGVNDGGDTTTTANANLQHSVGTMKFSGKSSDTEVANTIAQSRMGAGVLALTSTIAANSYAPLRSLDIDFNDMTDPLTASGTTDPTKFISANLNTISTYQYQAVLLGYVTTIKTPNAPALAAYEVAHPNTTPGLTQAQIDAAAWSQMQSFNPANLSDPTTTGIKGDTTGDVAKFLANLLNSQGSYQSLTTTNDPADAFLNNSYLLPNLLANSRDPATGAITPNPNYDPAAFAKATALYANKFNADLPSSWGKVTETTGANSYYGAAVGGTSPANFNGAIPITAFNADGTVAADGTIAPRGNWLFGNFNQNGVRDLSAVESGLAAAKALYNAEPAGTSGASSAFLVSSGIANAPNSTSVTFTDVNGAVHTMTKGDIIVLGDFQGTGKFDGANLLALAQGAAVSDASGTGYSGGTLSGGAAGFADSVRNGVLRKNDALAYMQNGTADATFDANGNPTNASAFLRVTARVNLSTAATAIGVPAGATKISGSGTGVYTYTYDPAGSNAFNKADVNGDGLVDINDALVVDHYAGQDYTNLTQQLAATVSTDGTVHQLDLTSAKLLDGSSVIDNSSNPATSDLVQVNNALTGTGNSKWFAGTVTKDGTGTIVFARTGGTVTVDPAASLQIQNGLLAITGTVDPFTDTTTGQKLPITVGGGTNTATLQVDNSVPLGTVGGKGEVDLAQNGAVVFKAGSADNVRSLIKNGDLTATAGQGIQTVGYLTGAQYNTLHAGNSLGLGSSDVIAQYAYAGDTTLKGYIAASDFAQLDASYLLGLTDAHWINGDFNGDGVVNYQDYALADAALGAGGANTQLAATEVALDTSRFGAAFAAAYQADLAAPAATPEPASLALLGLGALTLLRRRRACRAS
jgi:hypothetical protein